MLNVHHKNIALGFYHESGPVYLITIPDMLRHRSTSKNLLITLLSIDVKIIRYFFDISKTNNVFDKSRSISLVLLKSNIIDVLLKCILIDPFGEKKKQYTSGS